MCSKLTNLIFGSFDAENEAMKIVESKDFSTGPYQRYAYYNKQLAVQEIMDHWQCVGDLAWKLHEAIDIYYKFNRMPNNILDDPCFKQFLKFDSWQLENSWKAVPKMSRHKFMFRGYDGVINVLYVNENEEYMLVSWKRLSSVKYDDADYKAGQPVSDVIQNTQYNQIVVTENLKWHYLLSTYDILVGRIYSIQFCESNETYVQREVTPFSMNEMEELFQITKEIQTKINAEFFQRPEWRSLCG